MSETVGAQDAARILRLSVDALMRKSRAGIVPGAKIGRQWVYVRADLIALVRERAKVITCRCTVNLRAPTGGSDSASVASRLDAALVLQTRQALKSSKQSFDTLCGEYQSLVRSPAIPGPKRSSGGKGRLRLVGGSGTGRG